jgi:molybdopterin converting factor small subunit
MRVTVCFYSYFKDLTGCACAEEILPDGSTLEILLKKLHGRFPKLVAMQKSTLAAVGLDYQRADYVLKEGDEVSLFPPVQGG